MLYAETRSLRFVFSKTLCEYFFNCWTYFKHEGWDRDPNRSKCSMMIDQSTPKMWMFSNARVTKTHWLPGLVRAWSLRGFPSGPSVLNFYPKMWPRQETMILSLRRECWHSAGGMARAKEIRVELSAMMGRRLESQRIDSGYRACKKGWWITKHWFIKRCQQSLKLCSWSGSYILFLPCYAHLPKTAFLCKSPNDFVCKDN